MNTRRHMSKNTVEINTRSMIKFWLILLGIALVILFLYKAMTGLIIIGISIFFAIALKPFVNKLNKFMTKHLSVNKSHKTASAVLAYIIIVAIVLVIFGIVGPVVVNETSKFVQQFPTTFNETVGGWDGINEFGRNIGISNLQEDITKAVSSLSDGIFGNLGNTIVTSISAISDLAMKGALILILTLLFMLEGPSMSDALWRSLGADEEDNKQVGIAKGIVNKMAKVISTYVSRQALVALIDGAATMLFVFVLSLIFQFSPTLAVPMGLIAAVFYLIPMFGQIISAGLVSILLAFSSPIAAGIFIITYLIYAQIENNVIAPKIQGDALKLPAVAILSAMIIGMYMFGLVGAIVAIPIAGCIRVLVDEFPNIRKARK